MKYIRALRKQNTDLLTALKQTEQKLLYQEHHNDELQEEIQKLQNQQTPSQKGAALPSLGNLAGNLGNLGNFSKKITAIFDQKNTSFSICSEIEQISIEPDQISIENHDEQETPQILSLKSQISTLNNQINQLKQSLSNSQQSELTIREFASTLQTKLENKEMLAEDLSTCKNKLNESLQNIEKSEQEIERLKEKIEFLQKELEKANNYTNEIKTQNSSLQMASSDLQQLMNKYSELAEQHENMKEETIKNRIQQQEFERQIENLKESLKKSIRTEQEKDEQIRQLTQQSKELDSEKYGISQQVDALQKMIKFKENEINELKEESQKVIDRLNAGKGSIETEAKIQKMQRLVEKSNTLYAEMQQKAANYENRVHELEKQIFKEKTKGKPIIQIKTPKGSFVLCEGGTYSKCELKNKTVTCYEIFDRSKRMNKESMTDITTKNDEEKFEYLKKLVFQYFNSDSKIKNQLMPVILGLLDLRDEKFGRL
ncbi:NAC domain containing protein [Tritrichomonas foetus]|uniref:NAC domain containing protein n=1 Tax=Tritrichomonas foetus TaxID=1144522 RepID=A0A1J4JG61_9EUKA|nr:NAC domain containing protein [Tritrichomonas foetus]|eukprot:OHS97657.1 NAC domain containing protein [Tritrichomonas foetus]